MDIANRDQATVQGPDTPLRGMEPVPIRPKKAEEELRRRKALADFLFKNKDILTPEGERAISHETMQGMKLLEEADEYTQDRFISRIRIAEGRIQNDKFINYVNNVFGAAMGVTRSPDSAEGYGFSESFNAVLDVSEAAARASLNAAGVPPNDLTSLVEEVNFAQGRNSQDSLQRGASELLNARSEMKKAMTLVMLVAVASMIVSRSFDEQERRREGRRPDVEGREVGTTEAMKVTEGADIAESLDIDPEAAEEVLRILRKTPEFVELVESEGSPKRVEALILAKMVADKYEIGSGKRKDEKKAEEKALKKKEDRERREESDQPATAA